MRSAVLAFAAFLVALAAPPAAAQMYKIVGADGKVTYSDKPPADAKSARVTEMKVRSYGGPPQVGTLAAQPDWGAILRRPVAGAQATAPAGLMLFSAEWCGPCRRAKQYMGGKGIAYTNIDVDNDAQGKVEYRRLGGRGIPFFVLGDKTMTGFSEGRLDAFLGGGS